MFFVFYFVNVLALCHYTRLFEWLSVFFLLLLSFFLLQEELLDFNGSKSATPATASDMERADGKSKNMEVQAAPGTGSILVGRVKHHALVRESHSLVIH